MPPSESKKKRSRQKLSLTPFVTRLLGHLGIPQRQRLRDELPKALVYLFGCPCHEVRALAHWREHNHLRALAGFVPLHKPTGLCHRRDHRHFSLQLVAQESLEPLGLAHRLLDRGLGREVWET